jgi:hypothetical protein
MHKTILILMSVLLFNAFGADKVTESKVKIGILHLESYNGTPELTDKASLELATIINDIGFYDVYSEQMLRDQLKKLKQKMPAKCNDPKCVLDIGKSTNMNRMVYGSIDKNNNRIGVQLTLIDILMNQTIGSVNIQGDPGVGVSDILNIAIARLHGTPAENNAKVEDYFGPEIHHEKEFLYSTLGLLGFGLIWGLANSAGDKSDNKLFGPYSNYDLEDRPSMADQIPLFARPGALGNSYTAVSDDAYGVFYNPAGIGWIDGAEAVLAYQYRFGINNVAASYVNKATRELSFGQGILYSGDPDKLLTEMFFVSSIAYKFNDIVSFLRPFSLGANVKIASQRYKGTEPGSVSGSGFGVGLDLGLIMELSDQIRYGLEFRDLPLVNKYKNNTTGEKYFENATTTMHMGGSFRVGYSTFLVADGQIPLTTEQIWKMSGGIEQEIFKIIVLRGGAQKQIQTAFETPWKITGGIGLKFRKMEIDGSYEYNTLRVFNVVNVSYKWNF